MYSRHVDTSDSPEQVYRTKLLSLFYCRAVQDDTIEQFELVNDFIWEEEIWEEEIWEEEIWEEEFGDIRFKIKVKGHDEPGTVFVQTLHKTNKKHIHKIDLAPYFDSYMKIKHTFGETEWLFVLYTNANVDAEYTDASARSGLSAKLNDILDTGGNVKCPNNEENIKYLTKKAVKDQITLLAERIANYIDNEYFQKMMTDDLILRYHVILARKVFDVSEIQPESEATLGYRIASFRRDFFYNTEEYIVLFRAVLYLEFIKGRKLKPSEIQLYLSEFLSDPTDATRLSKLIGTVVTYNNGQLEFDQQFRTNMKPMNVPRATVDQAIELAAIEKLSSVKLKVPTAFGNKDLTISGSDTEIEERICHLASKMKELLDKCEASKIVTIDESMEDGFLQLNGGIAGAIGNIFVLDENTKLVKITDNWKSLSPLAQRLYKKLSNVIDNLHEYTFCFKVDKFPELLFDSYGEKMVKDFLNNLLVYCNQADENDVQEILKNEIEDLQRNQPNYFQIKSDVILIRYHNKIQKWHTQLLHQQYIQENTNLFRQSIDEILFNSLVNLISEPYINKIKQYDYTFTEDAVRSLNLPDQPSSTMIVTENCVLTVVKVMQHLKSKQEHFVLLDVEYIANLPANDQHALRAELRNTNQQDILILICDKIDYSHKKTLLGNIANAVRNKTIIVILNQNSLGILHKYFPEADNILHDKKFSLIDVDVQSQKRILNDATAVFPGVEIGLGVFLRGWPSRTSDPTDELFKELLSIDEPRNVRNVRELQHRSDQDKGYGAFHATSSKPTRVLSPIPATTFDGRRFYNIFRDAEFLKSDANVQEILARNVLTLSFKINTLKPGKTMIIEEMNLNPNTLLKIKNDGQNTKVDDFEFTDNCLVGLTAAYVYENRKSLLNILATEAEELGLEWDQNDDDKCKLYLSAVSGAEYFTDQFLFWPLVCGLRKYQLKKLTVDELLKMGNIMCYEEHTMARALKRNMATTLRIWSMIPDTSVDGLHTLMNSPELKKLFDG